MTNQPELRTQSDLDLLRTVLEEPITISGTPQEWFGLCASEPKTVADQYQTAQGQNVRCRMKAALELFHRALGQGLKEASVMSNPDVVKEFVGSRLHGLPHEIFAILYLDSQCQLIEYCELFRGTLNETSVYPREIVIGALQRNAAAVILVHNHPSGKALASSADETLTRTLRAALKCIDVRVLDHLIVGLDQTYSFAESGLL